MYKEYYAKGFKLNVFHIFACVFLESAADKPVVIPDKVNKWAGEDEEEDIKVRLLHS